MLFSSVVDPTPSEAITMEEIFEFKVTKQGLAKMPADERAFLFFLGHAINEISLLSNYLHGWERAAVPSTLSVGSQTTL